MRIRKRKVPLPLSLLSPIPLSDPHLFSQSPVHLHHHHQPQPSDYFSLTSAPSDLRPLIVVGNNTNPTSCGVKQEQEDKDEQQRSCLEIRGGGGGERLAQKSNNDNDDGASKEEVEVDLELVVNNNGPVGVSLSNEGLGRWSGGGGVLIPLKKRRPSESLFEKDVYDNCEEQTVVAANGSMNSEHDSNNKKASGGGGSTKQKRGTTIMEGSRCSRVNGRGWRCCQPTLVGYSLCEHHLGKGRLRSITSVRGRPSSKKQHLMVKDNYRDHQEKHQATSKRANYKLGVVKARSLSSLLGQTASTTTITTTTTTTSNNNNAGHDISSISNHESDAHVVALPTN